MKCSFCHTEVEPRGGWIFCCRWIQSPEIKYIHLTYHEAAIFSVLWRGEEQFRDKLIFAMYGASEPRSAEDMLRMTLSRLNTKISPLGVGFYSKGRVLSYTQKRGPKGRVSNGHHPANIRGADGRWMRNDSEHTFQKEQVCSASPNANPSDPVDLP